MFLPEASAPVVPVQPLCQDAPERIGLGADDPSEKRPARRLGLARVAGQVQGLVVRGPGDGS
jgi:hypothetical protein